MVTSSQCLTCVSKSQRCNVLWRRCYKQCSTPLNLNSAKRHLSHDIEYVSKVGLGGNQWGRMEPLQYAKVVQTALENGISTLEAGQDGESALAEAFKHAVTEMDSQPTEVELMARLGYRTIVSGGEQNKSGELAHDVTIEEHPVMADEQNETEPSHAKVVHNLSKKHVEQSFAESPLVQLRNESNSDASRINLVYMLHNPEVQGKDTVLERMVDAFCGLEEGIAAGKISSFGVCSNGLSLPQEHPFHLPFTRVLEAATRASEIVNGSSDNASGLSILQLPVNLLEPNGFLVARDVVEHLKETAPNDTFPSGIRVYAMRPLTCYSQGGTGTDHPLLLLDYPIPVMGSDDGTMVWTHEMEGPPPEYTMALNAAMGQFDATEILEAQQERKLTTEERETLDGCKLLHSMLHDLDADLAKITSFAAHEHELFNRVIPLIHDTFEELDDDSGTVLQTFFAAHGLAVRHAVAKRTRELLKEGSKESPKYDIPENMTLQEYTLRFLLRESSISKVIVGCEQPSHVNEAVNAAANLLTDV